MRIGIVGNGVVGKATGKSFVGHVDQVVAYDKIKHRSYTSLSDVLTCDLIMVCLPTPQKAGSLEMDLSAIEEFFTSVYREGSLDRPKRNYVLRSTVPIGTTRKLAETYHLTNLVHSPEFLTARTAVEDAANPVRSIIGVPDGGITGCAALLGGLYKKTFRRFYPSMDGPPGVEDSKPRPIHFMTSDESEAVKLFQNAHSAVKVSLMNEFRLFADKMGLDWERVLAGLLSGGWVNPAHTRVPGPDGLLGWGGSCLGKDLSCLISQMVAANLDPIVCSAALVRNREIDRPESGATSGKGPVSGE